MSNIKIKQKILILKKPAKINNDMKFDVGTEFEIVRDVVYMGGLLIPPQIQPTLLNWLMENMNNKEMFKEDLRRFK